MTPASRIWPLTVTVLGALSSVFQSCTVPLVGFAALGATTLSRQQAVTCLTLIWWVNQALGYGTRSYPLDAQTAGWGLVMLAGGLAALALGRSIDRRGRRHFPAGDVGLGLRVTMALMGGFLLYELILWLVSVLLGSAEGFTLAVLASVLRTNGLWVFGLTIVFSQIKRITRLQRPRFTAVPSWLH